jgi:glutathione synthase/RimK-type ligase-like ATP-grasp enzyme
MASNTFKRIGCFVEGYNFIDCTEAAALRNFKQSAERKGHEFDFIFKKDIAKIPEYDSLFIRAVTDPTYTACIVSKIANENGLKVVDDPRSIQICSNKVHMYGELEAHVVPYLPTTLFSKEELNPEGIQKIFEKYGSPVVIKAPYTSFSKYVEKVSNEEEFMTVAKRFLRRSDVIVIQKFCPTDFDWRVGVLNDDVLYIAKYKMLKGAWKHLIHEEGKTKASYGETESIPIDKAPEKLKKIAIDSCTAIGPGLFGVDIKEFDGEFVIVEVNDNPSLYAGNEDLTAPDIYDKIIDYLVGE